MQLKKLLFIGLYTFAVTSLWGQSYPIDTRTVNCDGLDNEICTTISEKVAQALGEYEQVATLLDPTTKEVSNESINKFYRLFDYGKNQSIYDDLSVKERMTKVGEYADEVFFSEIKTTGIKFDIERALLKKIYYDDNNKVYKADLEVVKVLYNGFDARKDVINYSEGRRCSKPYEFTYAITEDFAKVKISGLRNNCSFQKEEPIPEAEEPEATEEELDPEIAVVEDTPKKNPKPNKKKKATPASVITGTEKSAIGIYGMTGLFSDPVTTGGQIETTFSNTIGVGVLFRNNLKSSPLFIELGGEYFQTSLASEVTINSGEQRYNVEGGINGRPVEKIYTLNSYEEIIDVKNVNLHIGLAFRVVNSDRLKLDFSAAFLPSFNIGTDSEAAYDVDYINNFTTLNWMMTGAFLDADETGTLKEQYLVGNFDERKEDLEDLEVASSFAVRVGPRFTLATNAGFGASLFLGYTKSIGSLFSEGRNNGNLLENFDHRNITTSLLNGNDLTLDYLTVSLGIFLMKK